MLYLCAFKAVFSVVSESLQYKNILAMPAEFMLRKEK